MKICSKCGIEKSLDSFNNKKGGKSGKSARCIKCDAAYSKEWRLKNYIIVREKEKLYKQNNRDLINQSNRESYHKKSKEERRLISLEKRVKYREKLNQNKKIYRSIPEVKQKARDYVKNRYNTNIQFKLSRILRQRHASFCWSKGVRKSSSSIKELGCTLDELKKYLESKFEDWMTWDNHGMYDSNKRTWQIDHIIPLCKFDLTNHNEYKKAAHYTNLQPLESIKNLIKNKF
jgi:hypothetical protein